MKKYLCSYLILFFALLSAIGQQLQPIDIEHIPIKIKTTKNLGMMPEIITYDTTEVKSTIYRGFPATITTKYGYNSNNQLIKKIEWIIQESYRGRYQIVTMTQFDTLERKQSVLIYHKGKNHYPYKWMYKDPQRSSSNEITRKWKLKEAYNYGYQSDTNDYRSSQIYISRESRKKSILYMITYVQFDSSNHKVESIKKTYPHVSPYIPYVLKYEYVDGKLSRKIYYGEQDYRGKTFSIIDGKVKYHNIRQKVHQIQYEENKFNKDSVKVYPSVSAVYRTYKNGNKEHTHNINHGSCIDHYDTLYQHTGEIYPNRVQICDKKEYIYEQFGNYIKVDKREKKEP
ncbi:MAG: hypothetical protein IK117_07785 [Bacteroidales bacterium]|nr:hypothetical protein [Bacteroidales bacterium]